MRTEVAVVGAGPAGLSMGLELAGRGIDHVVLERGRVGETWRTQRWDAFRLNTPAWMNSLVADASGPESNGFLTRAEMVAGLEHVAESLTVLEDTAVLQLHRDGERLTLETQSAAVTASAVVVASGGLNVPRRSPLAERLPPRLAQLYSSDYRSPAALPEGAVLVVGSAQSGAQIAEDLVRSGRRTYLSTSKVWRMPWISRGRETFAWLAELGFYDVRPDQLPDPGMVRLAQAVVASGGRSLSLMSLARAGVTLLPRLDGVNGESLSFAGSVAEAMAFGEKGAATFRGFIQTYVEANGIDAAPDVMDETEEPLTVGPQESLDLRAAEISSVIWASGFGSDLSWVTPLRVDGRALPVHRGLLSDVSGLYFLGMPWLCRRGSGILFGFPGDAATIADHVTSR